MITRELPVYQLADYKPLDYFMAHVDLEIDLTKQPVRVKSVLMFKPNPDCSAPGKDLMLNGENMQLLSIKLDGKLLSPDDYSLTEQSITIKNIREGQCFTVESEVELNDNPSLFGLYQTENIYLVKAESQGMRRVFYCQDRPDNLATYTTKIIADKEAFPVLLSNGELISREEFKDGTHAITWTDTVPKPTYLFALVAGKLEQSVTHFVTQSGYKLPIEFYVPKEAIPKCDFAKEVIKKALKWEEDTFGLECELSHHMVAGVDKYASGASEPTGLNLFNTSVLYASPATRSFKEFLRVAEVVSHEYFHYRSGDRVTIRDWPNLTLKEGLTTFRAALFREDLFGEDIIRLLDGKNLIEDAPRPDSYTSVRSLYTAAAYEKGAHIFRMMMIAAGRQAFCAGLRKFFLDYDGMAVTLETLIKSLNQSTGHALPPQITFSDFLPWFTEPGIPNLDITDEYDPSNKTYTLKIVTKNGKMRPIPFKMGLLDKNGNKFVNQTLIINQPEMVFTFNDITSQPIPSLLRGFSAPVTYNYHYTTSDLLTLMQHDENLYNRCEASNKLICALVSDYCKGQKELPSELFQAFRSALNNHTIHPWLLADLITLPSEEELINQLKSTNLEKISEARNFILNQIVSELAVDFRKKYIDLIAHEKAKQPQFSNFDMTDAGRARLANVCLTFLSKIDEANVKQNALITFDRSLDTNMNDTQAALTLLCDMDAPEAKDCLNRFYHQWSTDVNATNFWLKIQAAAHNPNVVTRVAELMNHPGFDLSYPNKALALLMTFINNPYGFHAASGAGYKLIADAILQLDKIKNAATGARLAVAFNNWNTYDAERQVKMYECLLYLDKNATSADILGTVKKGLEKGKPESFFLAPKMEMWKKESNNLSSSQKVDELKTFSMQ